LVPVNEGEQFELVLSGSHKVDAFNPVDGAKLWTVEGMSRECIPSSIFGNGLVYAVSGPGGETLAIRPGGRGNVTGTHVRWHNSRGAPFVPSPIVVGQHYYMVDDEGIGTCLDAQTGKVHWQKRFSGQFTSSPVAAGGNVYFTDEAGNTLVMAPEEDSFRQVARNSVNEPVFASPAISQGRFFLRTASHLFCIGGEGAAGR
jgi:outer membrane protein assembly factor BamB